jgi:hypothetical protein
LEQRVELECRFLTDVESIDVCLIYVEALLSEQPGSLASQFSASQDDYQRRRCLSAGCAPCDRSRLRDSTALRPPHDR